MDWLTHEESCEGHSGFLVLTASSVSPSVYGGDAENRLVGKERVGRIESHTDIHIPPCVQDRANGKLLYNTGGSAPCSVMT